MQLPKYPASGQPISARWGRDVVDYLKTITTTGDGKNIRAKRTDGGTTISQLPKVDDPKDFFGTLSNENEFSDGSSGIDVEITGGRIYGYYTTTTLSAFTTSADAAKDVWVEVVYDIAANTQVATFKSGTYPGFRSGATGTDNKNNLINYQIGAVEMQTAGIFKWVQKQVGSILVDTHVWPGEHLGHISRVQDEHQLVDIHYNLSGQEMVKHFKTVRYIKGLRTHYTVSTATSVFALCGCSTTVTTTLPPIFTQPDDLSGLILWLKAGEAVYTDNGITLAADGQTVEEWHDQSGEANDATQTNAADQPTFEANEINAFPVVRFPADFLDTGTKAPWKGLNDGSNFTIIFVAKMRDSTTYGSLLDNNAAGSVNTGISVTLNNITQCLTFSIARGVPGAVALSVTCDGGTFTRGVFHTAVLRHQAASGGDDAEIFVDGTKVAGADPINSFNNANPTYTLKIGAENGATIPMNADLPELMIYDRDLTASEQADVLTYLTTRYNL